MSSRSFVQSLTARLLEFVLARLGQLGPVEAPAAFQVGDDIAFDLQGLCVQAEELARTLRARLNRQSEHLEQVARREADDVVRDPRASGAAWITTPCEIQHASSLRDHTDLVRAGLSALAQLSQEGPTNRQVLQEARPDQASGALAELRADIKNTRTTIFKRDEFKAGQQEAIETIMFEKSDLVMLTRTAGGKSLVYSLPPFTPARGARWGCSPSTSRQRAPSSSRRLPR
ncbi:hypothetical protein T492DRAFT_448955 [Pavlovales sp. CCMP2436]|nr:hypothetical protein T492DRAFT_448955 [Pavlovales sp. CCMP2436]